MRQTHWSLALLMVVLGIMLLYFSRQPGYTPHPLTYVCGGVLMLAGAAIMLRLSFAFYLALGAGMFTLGVSVASFVVKQELVPTPPITGLMGLLVTARVFLARSFERKALRREAERAERAKVESEDREPPPPSGE